MQESPQIETRLPLNQQVRLYLDFVQKSGVPSLHLFSPQEARRRYHEARFFVTPDAPPVAEQRDLQIAGPAGPLPLRIYRPLGSEIGQVLPALIFFHGGGWTIGDLDTHDVFCRQLCNQTPCMVISVGYSLSPEAKFPVAHQECVAATIWAIENGSLLSLDPHRVAVGGDSAGGTIAAAVCLEARDWPSARPRPIYQVLIYPATDQFADTPSHTENAEGYFLTRDLIHYFRHQFIESRDYADWRASPLKAASLRGLPPALVMTAGYDPLRDEGQAYADRLKAEGVAVQAICAEDMIHGFIRLGKVIPDAQKYVELVALALRKALLSNSISQSVPEKRVDA